MHLGSKIMAAGAGAVVLAMVGSLAVVFFILKQQHLDELQHQMHSAIIGAENVRENMDRLHAQQAFDLAGLMKAAAAEHPGQSLREIYRQTALYQTIPVVAAWKSVQKVATENNFDFHIPSRPDLPARNPAHDNGRRFQAAFDAFTAGQDEYFGLFGESSG